MKEFWLNQDILNQMDADHLRAWRERVAECMGQDAIKLSQIDYALELKGER